MRRRPLWNADRHRPRHAGLSAAPSAARRPMPQTSRAAQCGLSGVTATVPGPCVARGHTAGEVPTLRACRHSTIPRVDFGFARPAAMRPARSGPAPVASGKRADPRPMGSRNAPPKARTSLSAKASRCHGGSGSRDVFGPSHLRRPSGGRGARPSAAARPKDRRPARPSRSPAPPDAATSGVACHRRRIAPATHLHSTRGAQDRSPGPGRHPLHGAGESLLGCGSGLRRQGVAGSPVRPRR